MAFAPGASPSVAGGFSPIAINQWYRRYSPDPANFAVQRRLFPEVLEKLNFASFDVLGHITDVLDDGNMDAKPGISAGRSGYNVILKPFYKDKLKAVRPSDAVNQRRWGSIGDMAAGQPLMLKMEEVAIQTATQQELMCVQALSGSLTATYANSNLTYTYPVLQFTPSIKWDQANATPIADIANMALSLIGEIVDGSAVLWMPLPVAITLATSQAFILLLQQSPLTYDLGIPAVGATVTSITKEQVGMAIQRLTGVKDVICYQGRYYTPNGVTSAGDEAYTINYFLNQKKVFMTGDLPYNQPFGSFRMCPTVNIGGYENPTAGRWLKVFDHTRPDQGGQVNGSIEVYGGFNGVPAIHVPNASSWAQVLT